MMKWLAGVAEESRRSAKSQPTARAPGGQERRAGTGGPPTVFVEPWSVLMAASKLYQSVKYKGDVSNYSRTFYI